MTLWDGMSLRWRESHVAVLLESSCHCLRTSSHEVILYTDKYKLRKEWHMLFVQ